MARDDFTNDGDGYSIDNVYTGGSADGKGHSFHLRVPIPTHWQAIMMHYVTSPDWPEYRSVQDFARDAIYHRWHWAKDWERRNGRPPTPELKQLMAMAAGQARAEQSRMVDERFIEFMDTTEEALRLKYNRQDFSALLDMVEELEVMAEEFTDKDRVRLLEMADNWKKKIERFL